MSILNCSTRLTIINCTGLNASFHFSPKQQYMRLQPINSAHINASIDTNANTFTEWINEWIKLISYGPTYNHLEWTIEANSEETVRFEVTKPLDMSMKWTDPSVSWETHTPGKWSIDIAKAVDVTIYLRAEVGKYNQIRQHGKPATVKSVELKPYLEIACDDDIPFVIENPPTANMHWAAQINIDHIIHPNT